MPLTSSEQSCSATLVCGPEEHLEGVIALCRDRVRTAATIGSQTLVNHPKMYPPKQPIEPTPPVFLGFLLVAHHSWWLMGTFCFLGHVDDCS